MIQRVETNKKPLGVIYANFQNDSFNLTKTACYLAQ